MPAPLLFAIAARSPNENSAPPAARTNVAELLRVKPQFRERGRVLIGDYIKSAELRELVSEGLAKAGLVLS